jgi:3-oxoacyl-[acyl-carrier protein] reductase
MITPARRRVILVTGGTAGIGLAVARAFVRDGACVSVVARKMRPGAEEVLARGGGRFYEASVSDFSAAERIVSEAVERFGALDVLVNNAGVSSEGMLWNLTEEQWDAALGTNLKGAFNYLRAAAPRFREQKSGKVVNVASTQALRARAGLLPYVASKAGLAGLTRAAARDLGKYGVNVNAVAPGLIETDIVSAMPEYVKERVRSETALGRIGTPEDVAEVVVFLASEAARHITGEIIRVDGGLLA